jgi:exodeoxyribonuclease VII large subunit
MGGLTGSGLAYEVKVIPTAVQGRQAASKVAAAISRFQSQPLDLIILVRGGGSKADLASFDHERVARAIATSAIPVWTGIGHTGDQSVADEVANRSFITPTECGQEVARLGLEYWRGIEDSSALLARVARDQILSADRHLAARRRAATIGARSQLHRHSDGLTHRARTLRGVSRNQIETHGLRLAARGGALAASSRRFVRSEQDAVIGRAHRLATAPERELVNESRRIDQWRKLLGAYDYRRQLDRGYSVTRDEQGRVIRSVASLGAGSRLLTRLGDGEVTSVVEQTNVAELTHNDEGN